MTQADQQAIAALQSGKNEGQENFPVASWLVRPDARAPVMAYYRFARAADDIADNPDATPEEKLRLLAAMRRGLAEDGPPYAMELGAVCRLRGIDLAHAHDLLDAFEQDCRVNRYADWDALIAYCAKSAMPVGRYVLDVHGESRALWPMNDALCAALQIINHLQDCGKDYRTIDRVYIPWPMLVGAGLGVEALGAERSDPALLAIFRDLTRRTQGLLAQAEGFADAIADWRLSCEVAVIQCLAQDLCKLLLQHDPLCESVHHTKRQAARLALGAALRQAVRRLFGKTRQFGKPGFDA